MGTGKKMNRFTEEEILSVASTVCSISPGNILLIGGGIILPQIIGYKRLRPRSDDLDFIANDKGISRALDQYDLQLEPASRHPEMHGVSQYTYLDGILVAISHNRIRGYEIPPMVHEEAMVRQTSQGTIHTITFELNTALKIRRGVSKTDRPHVYAKDGCDFASMVVSGYLSGEEFDIEKWFGYMDSGVCDSCNLTGSTKCMDQLAVGERNLESRYRDLFRNTLNECRNRVSEYCCSK